MVPLINPFITLPKLFATIPNSLVCKLRRSHFCQPPSTGISICFPRSLNDTTNSQKVMNRVCSCNCMSLDRVEAICICILENSRKILTTHTCLYASDISHIYTKLEIIFMPFGVFAWNSAYIFKHELESKNFLTMLIFHDCCRSRLNKYPYWPWLHCCWFCRVQKWI